MDKRDRKASSSLRILILEEIAVKILVIWEKFEDGIDLYSIKVEDEEAIQKIKQASGNIVGIENKDPNGENYAIWLSNYLAENATLIPLNSILRVKPQEYELFVHSGHVP